jgi:hypothetical protein
VRRSVAGVLCTYPGWQSLLLLFCFPVVVVRAAAAVRCCLARRLCRLVRGLTANGGALERAHALVTKARLPQGAITKGRRDPIPIPALSQSPLAHPLTRSPAHPLTRVTRHANGYRLTARPLPPERAGALHRSRRRRRCAGQPHGPVRGRPAHPGVRRHGQHQLHAEGLRVSGWRTANGCSNGSLTAL